jgi:predicted nucleic acid-binding protein
MRVWDANPRLGYVDACVVAAAQAKAMDLFTFDQAQRKALGRGQR